MRLLDVSRLIWRRWAGRLPTGIDRVCLAYLDEFGAGSLAVVQRKAWRRVLNEAASEALFALLRNPTSDFRRRFVTLIARWPGQFARPADYAGSLYLNIGHTGLDEPSLARWIEDHSVKAFYFVHDLIPLTHPEYCRAGEAERHAKRMRTVLASAAGVIGNSQQTIDDLGRWADAQNLAAPPALAALLGSDFADTALSPGPDRTDGSPTFLTVGTIEGRKNHLLLLQVWARLAARLGDQAPRLLIVGQRGWESEQAVDLLERSAGLCGVVEELGRCSDATLAQLLSQARALLFPSFAEGYGLPLAEALARGTPVIASDLAVFREIGSDIPLYLDPLDGPAWIDAILDFTRDDSVQRQRQIERLRAYKAPSWADHFAAVVPWLSAIEGRARP